MFQPRLINDTKLSKWYHLEYGTILQEALFTHFDKPYKAPDIPLLLKQESDAIDKYFCQQCNDSFYHASSLHEHLSRGSWILGYWCTNCFNECEHLPGQKQYCYKCMKLQHQKYKALQARGLNKGIDPGVVKIFFNPCQLLQHMQIHCIEEIYIHQLMLLPFPTGIGMEYFPHLKMISEALIDSMFLKNIHIVDWLWQNKIHKWWRMAKGNNPVANIIKKYPFEVQQIKQLLNRNTKVNLNSRLDSICIKKTKTQNTKNFSKKSDPTTSATGTNTIKLVKSSKLLNLKICRFPSVEQNNHVHPFTEENLQNSNLLSDVSKDNISVKKFAKIADSSLAENCIDKRILFHKQMYSNKIIPRIICSIPSESSAITSSIKSSNLSQKIRDSKMVFVNKNDHINVDSFHSHTKHRENSRILSIIRSDKVQFFKKSKTIQFDDLYQSNLLIPQSPQKKIKIINQITKSTSKSDTGTLNKQAIKFYSEADSQNHKSFDIVSEKNYFPETLQENISDIHSTNSSPAPIIINKVGKEVAKSESNVDLCSYVSTKIILEQLFNKDELKFLTVTNSEKGKSFLLISKNDCLENNAEYKKRMLSNLRKVNKTKIDFKIGHIKSLSRKYSEKFYILNDEIIDGHKNLICILENVAKNIELPTQSTEDFLGLSFSATSSSTCPTCHQIKRSPGYLIGFLEPLSELSHCLCYDFICFKCKMFQGNKKRFDNHLKYHQLEYPYTCPECELEFSSSGHLEVHTWTKCFHQFSKRFLFCTICEIGGFYSLEAIINHFVIMHSIKIAVCSLCCMVFEYKRYCANHIKKGHPEVKNYTEPLQLILCQLDDRIMPIECYNDHVMSHKCIQEINFYHCNLCLDTPKKFKTLESIKTHIYENHLVELSNIISENSLNEILSMDDIQAILKKQGQNSPRIELERGLNDQITTVSTSTVKENPLDDPSKEKYCALITGENPFSILANNTAPFNSILYNALHKEQLFESSNYFVRHNSSTETTNSKQSDFSSSQNKCSKQSGHFSIKNKHVSKTFKVQENVISHIPKLPIYAEKNILEKTQNDNTLNIVSIEKHQMISSNSFLTQMNKDNKKTCNISSESVDMTVHDLSNNAHLDFEKDREKVSGNVHQSYDGNSKTEIHHSYSNDNNLSVYIEKMNQVDMLNITSRYVTSVENNIVNKTIEDASIDAEKTTLVHKDVNKQLSVTCLNPCLSGGDTIKSNFNLNTKYNEEQVIESSRIDDLRQGYEINMLPNENFELTFQSPIENQEINTLKSANNYGNDNDTVTKQNFLENVLTDIAKISTTLEESNDYPFEKDVSLNINKNVECDIINNITNDTDARERIDLEKNYDHFTNKNNMILSKKIIRQTTEKSTNNFSEKEKRKNNSTTDLNRTVFRDEVNSNVLNDSKKNICIIGDEKNLKLLESHKSNVRTCKPLHIKPSDSIALSDFSNAWINKNFDNAAGIRLKNATQLHNKEVVEQTKHNITSSKSTETLDHNQKLDENNLLSTKNYDFDISNDMKGRGTQLKDLDTEHFSMQKKFFEKDDKSQDGLKNLKRSMDSLDTKDEMNLSPIELKNLSLTDDEKINLSKTSSLQAHNLKLSISENSVMNCKKLRPRIFNQSSHGSKLLFKKRKTSRVVFRTFHEKNNKNVRKQETGTQPGNTANRKLIKKKQKISKLNTNIKSKVALLQGNALIGKKLIIECSKQNENLKVKENLKKYWPNLLRKNITQSENRKSKEEPLHSQMSLSKFLKTSSQTSQGKKNKGSRIKATDKNRIGFFNYDCNTVNPCEFKCHLCGDLINTTWPILNDHYGTKHSETYEVCHVSLKLSRIFRTDFNVQADMQKNNKRKSIELLNTGLKKRKRRSMRTLTDKSNDMADRASGLYVRPEPIIDDEGNFKCKKCDERCANILGLRRHIYNNHRISEKNLICLECGENFVVSPSLQMHLKAFHEIDDPITYMNNYPDYAPNVVDFETRNEITVTNQCYVCMAVFKDSSSVDKHLRVHGMAFLNKKRLEARKAKLAICQEQVNNCNELDIGLQLLDN